MLNTGKRPFYARIEYRSIQDQVEQKLAEGSSIKMIYDALSKEGILTMAYATFCDYVRGGGDRFHGRKKEAPKRNVSEPLSEILDSIERRTDVGYNLKLIYQKLVERGLTGFTYSGFCDYFREAGAYLGSDIPDDFIFFEDDGAITIYYRLEPFLKDKSDKADSQNLQKGDSDV